VSVPASLQHVRVRVRGRGGRGVPVLVPEPAVECAELVAGLRDRRCRIALVAFGIFAVVAQPREERTLVLGVVGELARRQDSLGLGTHERDILQEVGAAHDSLPPLEKYINPDSCENRRTAARFDSTGV